MSPSLDQSPWRLRPRWAGSAITTASMLVAAFVALALGACGAADPSPTSSADAARRAYVDRASAGGPCSDDRGADAAASPATPWCSLSRAVEAAPAGSTILVRGGSYPRLVVEDSQRGDWLTIAPAPGETVTLDGFDLRGSSWLRFQGLRFRGHSNLIDLGNDHVEILDSDLTVSTQVRPSSHLRFEGNRIHDLPGPPGANVDGVGIWMATGSETTTITDVVIRDNRFSRLPNDAIYLDGDRTLIEHNVFEEIRSPDNDWTHADVIQSQGADDLTIRRNFARDNDSGILNTDSLVHGWSIENNVFVRSESQPLQLDNQLEDLRLVNNTFWDGGPVYLRWDDRFPRNPRGFVIANNLVTRLDVDPRLNVAVDDFNLIGEDPFDSPVAPHSQVDVVPRFVDRSRDDYGLLRTSPGVDQGTSAHAAPKTDRDGHARYDVATVPNRGGGTVRFHDVGAYETGASVGDRSMPRLAVSLAPRGSAGDVALVARCSSDCRLTAAGTVRAAGAGKGPALRRDARRARAGRGLSLRPRLGGGAHGFVSRARAAGQRPVARLTVTARFRNGVPARRTILVPLRR